MLFQLCNECIRQEAFGAAFCAVRQSSPRQPLPALEDFARQALKDANASGFVHVRDVNSGEVFHISTDGGRDLASSSLMAPLSVIKVYLAAEWLERGFGSTVVDCGVGSKLRPMLAAEMLIFGCDSASKRMAVILRQKLGSEQVLRDLRQFGLESLSLQPSVSDIEWGKVLSLGENKVQVTPEQLSAFIRAIGQGGAGLFSEATALKLRVALEGVVQRGTAATIKNALAGTGWRLGGKTGTGPGQCGEHCDGWFAGLLSDRDRPRFVILVFIRGRGLGSGLAAHIAASIAEFLVQPRSWQKGS